MRAFKRTPLVGVCFITNFNRYTRTPSKKKEVNEKVDWAKYDKIIETEESELAATPLIPSLSKEGMPALDWWCKYYASLGHPEKAPGYEESGMEYLTVFNDALEDVNGYNGFEDFLDTFKFVKSSRGNYDDPEEKEKSGELKGKVFITPITGKDDTVLLDPPGVEFLGTVKCLLRVYIIEAKRLVSQRKNGMCDPYLLVRCGKKKISLKKKYRADTLDPVFGEFVEMEVNIPVEKDLVITVMRYRKVSVTTKLAQLRSTSKTDFSRNGEQQSVSGTTGPRFRANAMERSAKRQAERYRAKILGIDFWYSQVQQEMDEVDKAKCQRAAAGKDGSEADKDKEDPDKDKEDDSKRKGHDDHHVLKWQRGDEIRAQRASIAQHGERPKEKVLTPEEKLRVRKAARERITGRPLQQ
ncbi:C2 domain protein, partial [Cooperia oncophora]